MADYVAGSQILLLRLVKQPIVGETFNIYLQANGIYSVVVDKITKH